MAAEESGGAGSIAIGVGANLEGFDAGMNRVESRLKGVKSVEVGVTLKPVTDEQTAKARQALAKPVVIPISFSGATGAVKALQSEVKGQTVKVGVEFNAGSAIAALQKQLNSHTFTAKIKLQADGNVTTSGGGTPSGPTGGSSYNGTDGRGIGFRTTDMRGPQAALSTNYYSGPKTGSGGMTGGGGGHVSGGGSGVVSDKVLSNMADEAIRKGIKAFQTSLGDPTETARIGKAFQSQLKDATNEQLVAFQKSLTYQMGKMETRQGKNGGC
jgi:hypothetical protein